MTTVKLNVPYPFQVHISGEASHKHVDFKSELTSYTVTNEYRQWEKKNHALTPDKSIYHF